MIAGYPLGRLAQRCERGFLGILRNGEQVVETFPNSLVQTRAHRHEPDVGGLGVNATSQTAQGAERRQLVLGGDQGLDRAIDQIRQVCLTAHDALHGLSGELLGVRLGYAASVSPFSPTRSAMCATISAGTSSGAANRPRTGNALSRHKRPSRASGELLDCQTQRTSGPGVKSW